MYSLSLHNYHITHNHHQRHHTAPSIYPLSVISMSSHRTLRSRSDSCLACARTTQSRLFIFSYSVACFIKFLLYSKRIHFSIDISDCASRILSTRPCNRCIYSFYDHKPLHNNSKRKMCTTVGGGVERRQ